MTIGIASPISSGSFGDFLNDESRSLSKDLSTDYAPAVTILAKEFLLAGHKVVVFTLDPKAKKELTLQGESLTIYVAPALSSSKIKRFINPFIAKNIRLISKLFKKNPETLDVLSVHWTRDYAIASRRFLNKIPVFVTVRDIIPYIIKTQKFNWRNYNWGLIYLMNEWVMRHKGYRFIANSQYTANSVMKYWGKTSTVICNPTSDRYFKIEYLASDSDDTFEISTISISQPDDPRKNIYNLLEAFQIVNHQLPNTRLNLIGQGFTKENPVLKEWKQLGLLKNVNLLGALDHDDVLSFLSKSHLMVHPSLEETFGNTLIESLAVGCPVIGGKDSGAVPYVLEHGKAGWLCDVTSVQSLSEAIFNVINCPDERINKSRYAKTYCFENFSSKNIADKYIKLFIEA